MTIKTRNKLNISLFIFSLVFLAANILILLLSIYTKKLSFQAYSSVNSIKELFLGYSPVITLISLYVQILYICLTSFMLYRVFEKTQASDISYFFLFLLALIANSIRIIIPLFNLSSTYSGLLIFCGNCVLFSKLLVPLSLLFSVIMGGAEQRQDLEKNIFILLLGCIFFSQIIPLNTANICKNFEVDYSYRNVIKITSILVTIAMLIALFFNNKSRMYTQFTTIGLALLSTGTYILFNAVNITLLFLAFLFLLLGTLMYLKELHRQYLWND